MVKMFVVSGLLVLAVVSIIIYFITARMVEPLHSMLDATHSFSRGDFSKRVPVNGYDEVGKLSMAFNNMASTLAVTESTRRSFIANVSHELKTPMTTISGFVDGVLDGTVPEEKRDQYLAIVSNECKRLSRLVRSMLDMARLEAGEVELNPVTLDISEIIRQTVFTFEHAIEEKELDVRGLETDRVMVLADKDLIHQVVYNLVDNAVKFVNPGGYIQFLYRAEQGMTFVTIRNSGEGIDKSEAPQLFERFYKSDRSRSLDKDGVGLGLHIVKSIIHYHKGDITVQSLQGQYTDFEFSLPNQ
jgi:signal transduction histidine kinase